MTKLVAAALIVSAFVTTAAQETLSGKWEGETRSGTPIVLTVAVKGAELTGTLVRSGETATISEGKVAKNTFTFKATVNNQAEAFSGELTGDEIKIWMDRQGPDRAIMLRRAKSK
jgi:hypothetical protein